ncbi:unnamed protein product [Scytosiphon promiscuus]
MPLDDAVLVRYLRARDGNIEKAAAMLTATLEWRRDFGLPEMLSKEMDVMRKENATGKMYLSGRDKQGRPLLVMRPRCENTVDHNGNIKHLVYQLERARAILQKGSGGLGKVCVVIDYVGFTVRNSPAMKTSMATLNILQNHYPETLGQAFFVSPPFVFKGFWKPPGTGWPIRQGKQQTQRIYHNKNRNDGRWRRQVIYPFIDKDTKEKFVFVSGNAKSTAAQAILSKNFDMDELEEAFGGQYTTKFDSAVYLGAPIDQDFREALAGSSGQETTTDAAATDAMPIALTTTTATATAA